MIKTTYETIYAWVALDQSGLVTLHFGYLHNSGEIVLHFTELKLPFHVIGLTGQGQGLTRQNLRADSFSFVLFFAEGQYYPLIHDISRKGSF